jgi:pyruvate kinase
MAGKKTKIVATLGPATHGAGVVERMISAGANVFRINLSHTTPEAFRVAVERVRAASERCGVPVGILADLRGPRIRIGEVENGAIELATGSRVILTPEELVGTPARLPVSFRGLAGDLEAGAEVLLDDGNIRLAVEELLADGEIACRVDRGGLVSSHRGVNLPHRRVSLPPLTEKDYADADLGIELGVDFFALSFVQTAADVALLGRHIAARGGSQKVIAKIERENAVIDVEAIAAASFGVMVARGDLALEMSIEETPIAQKRIMNVCRSLRRPVITATQMLESMTRAARPTRAEAADVANAILDGTDALMLSGETAVGVDPVRVVETMARIARRTERAVEEGHLRPPPEPPAAQTTVGVLADAAKTVAEEVGASLLIAYTDTGESAVNVASERPRPAILALCTSESVRRRLAVVWGVETRLIDVAEVSGQVLETSRREALTSGLAAPGERTVIIVGTLFTDADVSNVLKVDQIP